MLVQVCAAHWIGGYRRERRLYCSTGGESREVNSGSGEAAVLFLLLIYVGVNRYLSVKVFLKASVMVVQRLS